MTPTEDEILALAAKLHEWCHLRWETLTPEKRRGTTFHGPDAHLNEARRLLEKRAQRLN